MTLLEQLAQREAQGEGREEIARGMGLERRTVDWLMDSDSFEVIREKVNGGDKGGQTGVGG